MENTAITNGYPAVPDPEVTGFALGGFLGCPQRHDLEPQEPHFRLESTQKLDPVPLGVPALRHMDRQLSSVLKDTPLAVTDCGQGDTDDHETVIAFLNLLKKHGLMLSLPVFGQITSTSQVDHERKAVHINLDIPVLTPAQIVPHEGLVPSPEGLSKVCGIAQRFYHDPERPLTF